MDLTSILPLLMGNRGGSAENGDRMQTLLKTLNGAKNGAKPDIGTIMNLASNMKKADRKAPAGLKPIKNFVPDDILGRLVKFFA